MPGVMGWEINKDAIDAWTLGHVALGFGMGYYDFKFVTTLMVAIGWEVIEPSLKESFPDVFPHPEVDSTRNKIGDVLGVVLGFVLGKFAPRDII